MISYDAPDGGGDSNGTQFAVVRGIFVEAEEVCVGEIRFDGRVHSPVVVMLEEHTEIFVDAGVVAICEINEDVQRVHEEAIGFALLEAFNRFNYISGQRH